MVNCFKYFLTYVLGQNISKLDNKFLKLSSLYVLSCFKYFQTYILEQMSQEFRQEENLNYIYIYKKNIHKDIWTISSLCVSKWLDIYKEFWTISSNKKF